MSRRAPAEHPVLFVDASDIPAPPLIIRPPAPRAGETLEPFARVLAAADACALDELDGRSVGRTVLVGGERRPPEGLPNADALLDDGRAVARLLLGSRAPRSLRTALASRFILITGTVREVTDTVLIEPTDIIDLRALARDWATRR
jgi:hypothetical protein